MRIAVTYENGRIFQHFGHTAQFKIYDTQDGRIINSQVTDTAGSGQGALAGFLSARLVNTLICGGIGEGAVKALEAAGIALYSGISGDADEAVNALLGGTLETGAISACHEHEHGEGHRCGHNCGENC